MQPWVAGAENYQLTINGQKYDLDLGKPINIEINGKEQSLRLDLKDILTYQADSFSFKYSNKYSPSRSELGDGLYQTIMATPLGTVIMVQEYSSLNPLMLLDFLIGEVTKEEEVYGYTIDAKPSKISLASGEELNGKEVVSRTNGTDIRRRFYAYGARDSGLVIMTQIDHELAPGEQGVIDQFLQTFSIIQN